MTRLTIPEFGLLLWLVLMTGLVLQPLQFGLVQMLEGYWSPRWRWLEELFWRRVEVHRRRRHQLDRETIRRDKNDKRAKRRSQYATWQLRQHYPHPDWIMPTALGNVLRAAESRAGERYGMDTVTLWPRLHPVTSTTLQDALADQRNQLDLAVRFCLVFVTLGLIYLLAALLHAAGTIDLVERATYQHHLVEAWWLYTTALATLILSWLSYAGAIAAAESYGLNMEAAFDLHRFDLLTALHLPLRRTREAEGRLNQELSAFLQAGEPFESARRQPPGQSSLRVRYVHTPEVPAAKNDGNPPPET